MTSGGPFERLLHTSLDTRRKETKDPRLCVARAGYPAHLRQDDDFFKSLKNGKVSLPNYSQEKFCEGFNITALDFYIVRYRLCTLLYRNRLWLKKQKEGKQAVPDVEYDYALIEDKIGKHCLLSNERVHPYWKNKMIAEFVSKTADWMRSKKIDATTTNSAGEEVPTHILEPNQILVNPAWTWGEGVKSLNYEKIKHTSLDNLTIFLRPQGSSPDAQEAVRASQIIPGNLKKFSINDCSFSILAAIITGHWTKINDLKQGRYVLAYYNPYWGNELLRIHDDQTLQVAIETLRIRGVHSISFVVRLLSFHYIS